jgi:hypothetical protein
MRSSTNAMEQKASNLNRIWPDFVFAAMIVASVAGLIYMTLQR